MTSETTDAAPVALVTGSGRRRVGNVVVRSLAEVGYNVVVHYHQSRTEAEETAARIRELGRRAVSIQADVSVEGDVDQMFDRALEEFGRLDALVNTASVWRSIPLETVTAEDVLTSFRVNTLGTFLCSRRAGLIMTQQSSGGSIITIGDWAISRPYADYSAYFTAKGSLPTLTRALAVELGQRNPRVRVNCIHPGPVMFPEHLTPTEREQVIASTLVKQADCPERVADAVRFLIDNTFVTGVCLHLDGGRTIYAGD